jgi:hypothetical protein
LEKSLKLWAISVFFKTAQSKQSPIGRKFAQSGDTGAKRCGGENNFPIFGTFRQQ